MLDDKPQHRELTEKTPHMVWETDPRGMNRCHSPSWYRYVGGSNGACPDESWLDVCHPDDRESLTREWRVSLASEGRHPFDVEVRMRRHDGHFRWFRVQGGAVRNVNDEVCKWSGTFTDIDESKRRGEEHGQPSPSRDLTGANERHVAVPACSAKGVRGYLIDTLWVVAAVIVCMGVRALLGPVLEEHLEFGLAFVGVAVVAAVRGVVPGLMVAMLSALWSVVPWLPEPTLEGRQAAVLTGLFLACAAVVAVLVGRSSEPGPGDTGTRMPAMAPRSLGLLVAAGSFPLLFFSFVGWVTYQDAIEEAYARLDRTAAIATEHLHRVIETNQVIARTLLKEIEGLGEEALRADEPRLHEYVRGLAHGLEQIQSVWVWDAAGYPLISSIVRPAPRALNVSDREYFRAHRDSGADWYVTRVLTSRTTGEQFFDVTRRRDLGERFGGVISVSLRPEYFSNFYRKLAQSEPGLAIGLVREDGAIIARWPATAEVDPRGDQDGGLLARMDGREHRGAFRSVSNAGDDRVRHVAFLRAETHPLYLTASLDREAILASWYRQMAVLAVVVFPASLALVWLLFISFERSERVRTAYAEVKEEAAQRTRAEDALRHAQKLEALGLLTGGVAHDFNNLLAVVSNSVYLLKHLQVQRGADGDETGPVAAIERAVESGTKLTRQLLAFSRRQPLAPEVVNVHEVLGSMKELLQTIVSRQIKLEIDMPPTLPRIKVDPAELELGVINLVINARDAIRERGMITVSGNVLRSSSDGIAYVSISVRDNGVGIAPDVLGRVFDPFFTTKPRGMGTGLGLSQVYGLCTQAGGTVVLDSKPGAGTTVSMHLPVTADVPAGVAVPEQPQPADLGVAILLVEDHLDIGTTMQDVLKSLGCEVTYAKSADEAVEVLARDAARFAVVVSDVVMPGRINGIGLARYCRERWPLLPVVLMTGYTAELHAAVSDGFTVLPKPVAPATLARTLAKQLDGIRVSS